MLPSDRHSQARFLRLDHDEVDQQARAVSRQIQVLRQRLELLRQGHLPADCSATNGASAAQEATKLTNLIASRRTHLLNLERMRKRASVR